MTATPVYDNLLQKEMETYSTDQDTIKPFLKQNIILTPSYVTYNFDRKLNCTKEGNYLRLKQKFIFSVNSIKN